ncbi:uncharacterized protein LOC142488095 [Ascaphus truei]|uniref:uncharacterized protein LOC142488095 n=1 Tax=Ascaphus truei TaxID=8439 RepID=UPI003F5A2030
MGMSMLDLDEGSKLKKKIQQQRVHATGTGGGPTPQRLILTPLEELLRAKLLPVVVEGLPGDRDIGIYPSQFPPVAPEGHVSPETEQVSSPGSASSTHLEEHDDEDYDDDDDDDDAAIDTQIQASDHEEVPIETVLPPNRPANTTYDAIVASEGKIVEAENRRHSDLMTVLERMIALQEETVSQLAHLHRVFIEVPKQLQKINTSFEALVVQQTQANYLRMTNVPQFNLNTSQAGSVHAGQFSPHASDLHSPGPNVTGQVADITVQVPDDMLPLPSPPKDRTRLEEQYPDSKQQGSSQQQRMPRADSLPLTGYIDDILIIWSGSRGELDEFITFLNENDQNIVLIGEVDPIKINFLDLNLKVVEHRIVTKTHFKKDLQC